MELVDKYSIWFSGLQEGAYDFAFKIDGSFFSNFPNNEITGAKISAAVSLEKKRELMICKFTLKGTVTVECDRCLDPLDIKLSETFDLNIKIGEKHCEISEDTIEIPFGDGKIDLSDIINEFVTLSLPFKRAHPENKKGESACNSEVLKLLNNSNQASQTDERWNVLNKLLN